MPASRQTRTSAELPPGLRVSAYDRVAGTIVALLVIVGFGVMVLVLLWLAGRAMAGNEQPPVAVVPENPSDGLAAQGLAQEMVEPGVDFAELETPQLADSLAAVTTSVTLQQASLEELFGDASELGAGQGDGNRHASGTRGMGETKSHTPQRALSLNATSAKGYARFLDGLGIEMGVLGGGLNGITYVSQFTADEPLVREGTGDTETRFYFSQDSQLVELDQQLLADAGVESHNRVIVYFVPRAGERQLLAAEAQHAGRTPEQILRTIFGVRSAGDAHEFYVIEQEPRP